MWDPTHGLFRIPTKEERIRMRGGAPLNPIKVIIMLSWMDWVRFFCGLFAWIMDSYDFFAVSMSVGSLQKAFSHDGKFYSTKQITYAIMLTLLLRSAGALIFGILADRYGRRWVLTINLVIVAALSLSTAYCTEFKTFLGVRSIFGIAMGGIWGMANATCLEDMPPAARGLFSGFFQEGYAIGYLIAAAANLSWVNKTAHRYPLPKWEYLFYLGAGLSLLAAIFRALVPEGANFKEQRRLRKLKPSSHGSVKSFLSEVKHTLAKYWPQCIFGVLLMIGFNFFSHSSQDLYPSIVQNVKGMSADQSSVLTIIANCGAIAGGLIAGYLSQYVGRRIAMVMFIILAGAMVPAWILPNTFSGLAAGAFFVQVGVQGAWGVVPVFLSELSPPNFRATFPGLAYQLGNMASSASATIEETGAQNIRVQDPQNPNKTVGDSATVSAILLGCVAFYLLVLIVFGLNPEQGQEFAISHDHPNATSAEEAIAQASTDPESRWHNGEPEPVAPVHYVQDLLDQEKKI
ncbi:carboxylic acid transporter [Malassezia pachydermatis]|uniref:Carboxylic acid transporter n=1 Tax=Malassezia pachydermatis TaxID=77020 RepID=A0A0M9VQN6_9BASI|nr:carboxylic acid transporter [Malassezia pachydermatis]KOS15742.1 carboxylic acid transporter [Malassezia pachydermatis]